MTQRLSDDDDQDIPKKRQSAAWAKAAPPTDQFQSWSKWLE